jgi:hypothetical protein
MVNQALSVLTGVTAGSMVSYIIEFLIGVGALYLTVLGAVKLWDGISTVYRALRADIRTAKEEKLSLFGLWKERAFAGRPSTER